MGGSDAAAMICPFRLLAGNELVDLANQHVGDIESVMLDRPAPAQLD